MKEQSNNSDSLQHRIFRADSKLSSTEINELLGIRVSIKEVEGGSNSRSELLTHCNTMFKFALITIGLASIALLGTMYQLEIGPFYESEVYASARY